MTTFNIQTMMEIDLVGERPVPHKDYQEILYRRGHDYFVAFTQFKLKANGTVEMWNDRKVDPAHYCPKAPADVRIAPTHLLPTCHIKYQFPNLWPGMELEHCDPKKSILREVSVCEMLAKQPHPNIAKYIGCIVEDGFIKGVAYEKYAETLADKVNPYSIGKRSFQYGESPLEHGRTDFMGEVTSAVNHLHSVIHVGHNDLKPENLMVDFNGAAIVIDFDSCLPIGASCVGVGRTEGWCDYGMEFSDRSSDYLALMEIAEWLSDTEPRAKRYMFD